MRIAMIGTRGIPASYGGFETCVEEISKRLVEYGCKVTVYCRSNYYKKKQKSYKGIELVYLPTIKKKSIDTFFHTFLSIIHATFFRKFDVFMVFNVANSPFLLIPRLFGRRVALNTDGLEWKREKWGRVAKAYYKFSEFLASKTIKYLVSDSEGIYDYYKRKYKVDSTIIEYGAYIQESTNPEILNDFGLNPRRYFLQITRFEPENNPLLTIKAFERLDTDMHLVLVGGTTYKSNYYKEMLKTEDKRIKFLGSIYDQEILKEIWTNCYAYIHGNEVGGTNPALLQAMAAGCFVIARDVVFNRAVLAGAGIYFKKDATDLAEKMLWTIENSDKLQHFRNKAKEIIKQKYSWDRIAKKYYDLFLNISTK